MNQPLPGTVSTPITEDVDAKDMPAAPHPGGKADTESRDEREARPQPEFDDDDEYEGDEEEDDEDRARRAAARAPAPPPAVPVRFADVISGQFDEQADSAEAALA